MHFFLIANDYGESLCLDSISSELKQREHTTIEVFGRGKNLALTEKIVQQALDADVFITAISEFNEAEVALAKNVWNQKPCMPTVVYAPGRYAFRNKGATSLRGITDLLLVGNTDEVEEAKTLYPRAAQVAAVGNVLHENFYPELSMAEARKKIGVGDNQKLIFVPGDKRLGINWPLFHSVIEAAHRACVQRHSPMVAIGIHPGDQYPIDMYHDAEKDSRNVPVKIFMRDILTSAILVTACDLMVTAVSSLATMAAFQRKPIIGFYFENLLADAEDAQGGKPLECELESNKAAEVVRGGSVDLLAETISRLLSPNGFRKMRRHQKIAYPEAPIPGSTAKKAVDIITRPTFNG